MSSLDFLLFLFFILYWCLFWGVCTAVIASELVDDGLFLRFLLGFIFGPIAAVLAFKNGARCEACKSRLHVKATVCPKCGMEGEIEVIDHEAVNRRLAQEAAKNRHRQRG